MPDAPTLPQYEVVEALGDGRVLVVALDGPDAGVAFVHGTSNREPEAARMGRLPLRAAAAPQWTAPTPRRATARTPAHRPAEAGARAATRAAAARKADALFESLLDPHQRRQWRDHRCCWVATPRGPVRLGHLHDLRFRPIDRPSVELSLCVVPTGPPLPFGDVWSNLLLVLAADPDRFFAVANVSQQIRAPSAPHPPRWRAGCA